MYLDKNFNLRNQWARQHAANGVREEWNKLVERSSPQEEWIDHKLSWAPDPTLPDPADLASKLFTKVPAFKAPSQPELPSQGASAYPARSHSSGASRHASGFKVGIVGAGAAGLFTALILDHLNSRVEAFNVSYDILEAAAKDRVGGRLYTHNFDDRAHQYYDVGAMRFPDNPVMTRTFALFSTLDMKKADLEDSPPLGSLIHYYMRNGSDDSIEPWCYNGVTRWGDYDQIRASSEDSDPFNINRGGTIDERILQHTPSEVMKFAIKPLRDQLEKDSTLDPPGSAGWDLLMEYDGYSTRQFLTSSLPAVLAGVDNSNDGNDGDDDSDDDSDASNSTIPPPPYNYDTVEWLETFNAATGGYDQALSEAVLESLDFDFSDDTEWYCILGGAQQLAKRMEDLLQQKPTYESTVTRIRALGHRKIELQYRTGSQTKASTYAGVFNTTTFGCLKRIDTTEAGLNYATKQALRSLRYGSAAKVGIQFKSAWWIHKLKSHSIKMGGLGHSDLNMRTCVYPSYNILDDESTPAVLLCSYTVQQDAQRIAALISKSSDPKQKLEDEAELKELLISDLVRLHRNSDMSTQELDDLIRGEYVSHHAFEWYQNPLSVGAFAFFRPQQFTGMWNKLIHPSGDLIIIGEAASPHHAWVVGALESAVHGVHTWLEMNKSHIPGAMQALGILETPEDGNPFVGLPPYLDARISAWQALLAMNTRDEYLGRMGREEVTSWALAWKS